MGTSEMAQTGFGREQVRSLLRRTKQAIVNAVGAGPVHRSRLNSIDTRIVIAGVRGKSSAARWLHDVFHRRGNDTFVKITGDEPHTIYNGERRAVERNEQVRLYENERELRRATDADVAIIENQGIRQYTTRLVNSSFVKPDVLLLTNIREDHMDTLGRNRVQIARSLARAVPAGTAVINGEQDRRLRSYITAEFRRRDVTVQHVDPPSFADEVPGAEVVFGLNDVLTTVGESPLPHEDIRRMLMSMLPQWRVLPSGRLYNAASVNDVQSTELIRRALLGDGETIIEPLVSLRADRRGRTASFKRYFEQLVARGCVERVHAIGDDATLLDTAASYPVETYDTETTEPGAVLDSVLEAGNPVILMGNTVTEYMRDIAEVVDERTVAREPVTPEIADRLVEIQ